jgi:hypothetical protein
MNNRLVTVTVTVTVAIELDRHLAVAVIEAIISGAACE